jgi:hypothetical protein
VVSNYRATVSREGKWWMIAISELGELTQARRLSEVEQLARELIAVSQDVPLSTVKVDIVMANVGNVTVDARVTHLREERAKALSAERAALSEASRLARELAAEGVPMRDIGTLLDVSFQRAHQLANSS